MSTTIETKVIAAASGAGAGAIIGSFLTWLIGVTVFGASATAQSAVLAVAAVPGPVAGLVVLVVTVAGSAAGGFLAPHTSRPDLAAVPAPEPVVVPEPAPVLAPVEVPAAPEPAVAPPAG